MLIQELEHHNHIPGGWMCLITPSSLYGRQLFKVIAAPYEDHGEAVQVFEHYHLAFRLNGLSQ